VTEQPTGLGPVQLLVIAFEGGKLDSKVLEELRRLREDRAVRLVDLLFVAKGEEDEVIELVLADLTAAEAEQYGALVSALMGIGVGGDVSAMEGERAVSDAASRNGSLTTPGSSPTRSPLERRRPSSCSSTGGPCRCATRSRPPPATTSSIPGSTLRIWPRSAPVDGHGDREVISTWNAVPV
jgi:hypothetical protein